MNEAFNKSLNAVLATTTDKIIAHVKADTDTALEANRETMTAIIKNMDSAAENASESVKKFYKNLNEIFKKYNKTLSETSKKSKSILDNHTNAYSLSVKRLFVLDGWRKKVFWVGICASIVTPFVLMLRLIF
ncbi:MAG: hypothetical protein FWG87_14995 [Defluviitaleaceae bacterium]|nr:hypothetical protein [Defluviitaleaceae bacterium]